MASSSTTNAANPDKIPIEVEGDYLSTVSVANFVPSKLSGDKYSNNYFSWRQQFLCFIESQGLLRFIDGRRVLSTTDDVLFPSAADDDDDDESRSSINAELPLYRDNAEWRIDRVVKGWILESLDDTVANVIIGRFVNLTNANDGLFNVATARDIWLELEKKFTPAPLPDVSDYDRSKVTSRSKTCLLCILIKANIFDLALHLAEKYPHLALLTCDDGSSALQRIVLKDSIFSSRESNFWERFIHSVPCAKKILPRKQIHQHALELVKFLCKNMVLLDLKSASKIFADVIFTAARLDVHEVIEEVMAEFPGAIYSRNDSNQYIFHVAVENRSEKVFNLIYQMSSLKHQFLNEVDSSGNTLLHLAGRLAPSHKLNLISGAALQMQRELQWFQEVEKLLQPYSCERSNKAGKTPRMVFTEEHMQLKADGEKWIKDTSTSFTIVAALVATVVFAAAITVLRGNQSDSGFPLLYSRDTAKLFAVSDTISFFTSVTSLLMFLSILTSRYAEQDFLKALPRRLRIGLITLFMSICFMMVAFSAIVFMVFGRDDKSWILISVAVLASLPVTLYVFLQFPLLWDVVSNTYGRGIFGRQSNRPFS